MIYTNPVVLASIFSGKSSQGLICMGWGLIMGSAVFFVACVFVPVCENIHPCYTDCGGMPSFIANKFNGANVIEDGTVGILTPASSALTAVRLVKLVSDVAFAPRRRSPPYAFQ